MNCLRILFFLTTAISLAACGDDPVTEQKIKVPTAPKVVLEGSQAEPAAAGESAAPVATATNNPQIAEAENKLEALMANTATLQKHQGRWQMGSYGSDFTGYFENGQLRMVEEHINNGEGGTQNARYYFDNGALTFYSDEGNWLEIHPPAPMSRRTTLRKMVFDQAGRLVAAKKTLDGAAAGLAEYEAFSVLKLAVDLQVAARAATAVGMGKPMADAPPASGSADAAGTAADTGSNRPAAVVAKTGSSEATAASTGAQTPPPAKTDTVTLAPELLAAADKLDISATAAVDTPAAAPDAVMETSATAATPATAAAAEAAESATAESLKFSAAQKQLTLNGTAAPTQDYVFRGKTGQTVTLKLTSDAPEMSFAAYRGNAEIISGLREWSSKLYRDGTYKISVSNKNGESAFTLNVTLE